MKFSLFVLLAFAFMARAASADDDTAGIPYAVASWSEAGFGNHRAVLHVDEKVDAAYAVLPWRRQDREPEKKAIVIFDGAGRRVENVVRGEVTREQGEIIFQPASGPGDYFAYFMPNGKLADLAPTAQEDWLRSQGIGKDAKEFARRARQLPALKVLRFESKSDFDRRDPMELIATAKEMTELLAQHPKADYLLFPEDRRFPTRMLADLPYRWIRRGPGKQFAGEAAPNETFAFQIGVFAAREKLTDVRLEIGDLRGPSGAVLPAKSIRCINAGGNDSSGRPFTQAIVVERGMVQPLWFLVEIPADATAGKYEGAITVRPVNGERQLASSTVALSISVSGEPVAEHGSLDAWRMSRLAWLDSTRGLEDDVVPPFIPVEWQEQTAKILNRTIRFSPLGFPEQITAGKQPLLDQAVTFTVEDDKGPLAFTAGERSTEETKKTSVTNRWEHRSDKLRMTVQATVEFDGCIEYRIKLRAVQDFQSKDVALDIPLRSDIGQYFMGLGHRGGFAPEQVQWKWDVNRVTNKLWTGNAVGGLILNLKHNEDVWPNAFNYRSWGTPRGWDNHGNGGCNFTRDSQTTRVRAYSGSRSWKAGEEEEFRFQLFVTPFKPIDMGQFRYRYASKNPRHAAESSRGPKQGCNIAHVHHAMSGVNPWINYPFLRLDGLKAYRDLMLSYGYRDLDLYYTLREISNHMPEIWAMRSLEDEIFSSNESVTYDEHGGREFKGGGGYSWLQEHLVTGYAPAWIVGTEGSVDAAIATHGVTRLHNFYVEGMDLLMKRVGFQGLYLDGIGYDRRTMQRIARVMSKNASEYRIKMHSGNNFDYGGWRCNSLLHYGEHLPYITDLYIGEGYNYNASPDHWFVEMSGIPFGLTNEMLGSHNNPWRGMIYGMDSRDSAAAPALWKLWDSFGIEQSQMTGYWDPGCPVKTDQKNILATVYRKERKTLVAVASWNPQPQMCRLEIDWKALGLDPQKTQLYAPAIEGFQTAATASAADPLPVMPGRGYLLLLDEQKHEAPPFVIPDAYAGRELLLQDNFDRGELGESWKLVVSEKPATSVKLADHAIVIESPANCFAFAERSLPAAVGIVECQLDAGTDAGATWGTGCALVWADRTLRLNLRADRHFGVDGGNGQALVGDLARDTLYSIRFRIEKDQIHIESSEDRKLWWTLHSSPRSQFPGDPVAVRLGKMNASAGAENFATPGPVGTSRITKFQVYGGQRKGM